MNKRPAVVYHPGEHLRDELVAREWTQAEFANKIKRPQALVSDIVNGRRGISVSAAIAIGKVLGTSAELWLNLDSAYRLWKYQEDKIVAERFRKAKMKKLKSSR